MTPTRTTRSPRRGISLAIPRNERDTIVIADGREVRLTNLAKPFWPDEGITKGDLLQYYADVAPVLLPHLRDRAMVMKRYPNGALGKCFFMKRAPTPRPDWIETCAIEHRSGNVIDFPIIQDVASLLWVINLGCIDLNPWYARCDDYDRPDYLHFDLDPVPGATFAKVLEASLLVHVVDASDPGFERQLAVTEEVLDEIGAQGVPRLLVFNKIDRGGDAAALRAQHPGCIVMSARRAGDVARLREAIVAHFRQNLVEAEIFLPWSAQKLRGEIFATCEVLEERAAGEGAFLRVRGEPEAVQRLRERAQR